MSCTSLSFLAEPLLSDCPNHKRVRQKVKAALFWEFSISLKPVLSTAFDYLPLQWLRCCFHQFFCSLWCACVWMGVWLFGIGHCCSTSFPDVLHWSVSNLVLASWQSWLPSGINYASMWFISVDSSTQHSSLPNPIGSTSVAQPLHLSPNQIYWVCVASVSPCLHPPRAISTICPRQFHNIHCSKVLLGKECTVSH